MYLSIIVLPLISFLCIFCCGRFFGKRGTFLISILSAFGSSILGMGIFYEVALCGVPCQINYAIFCYSDLFDAHWGFLFDTLTAIMCVVVTIVSFLVILYSGSYMGEDPHFIRFISYLKLFTVAMLILVISDNLIGLFVGWEFVGLSSFLLISFWFTRPQAIKAGLQAMIINRIGDIGLILGIISFFSVYKTTNYHTLFASIAFSKNVVLEEKQCVIYELVPIVFGPFSIELNWVELACIFLIIGAAGKSGQFFLHSWLPNAMNAPTPVSALLHAATMVTAGIFLVARVAPLLQLAPFACKILILLGAITTVFAGTVGLVQNDIKSIIAFSTCSQLGYMLTICGLANFNIGLFHLFNHAFFKALLFLTAGGIIHEIALEQDVRRFGGLQQILKIYYMFLLIGTLTLVGMPFLTGYYSKDLILENACAKYDITANFAFILTYFSVLTTAFYSFRLLFITFFSKSFYYSFPFMFSKEKMKFMKRKS